MSIEDQLQESMRHRVGGIALTSDVLGRATRRHQSRTTKIKIGYGLGAAGLAGVLAAGLTLSDGPGVTRPPTAVQAEPASMILANAAVASDNISYRIRLRVGTLTYEGAFDPRTDTGYLRSPHDDSVLTEFLIDGTRYIGGEPPLGRLPADKAGGGHEKYGRYGQYPGKFDRLSIYGGSDGVLDAASPDPAALFTALKKADATTRQNPDGTLHFEYTRRLTQAATGTDGTTTTAGDVTLDAAGRITKVDLTASWKGTSKGRYGTSTSTSKLELSDYGVVVEVKRPADVVPATD
jgi:hypothetical protein